MNSSIFYRRGKSRLSILHSTLKSRNIINRNKTNQLSRFSGLLLCNILYYLGNCHVTTDDYTWPNGGCYHPPYVTTFKPLFTVTIPLTPPKKPLLAHSLMILSEEQKLDVELFINSWKSSRKINRGFNIATDIELDHETIHQRLFYLKKPEKPTQKFSKYGSEKSLAREELSFPPWAQL